MTKDVSFGKSCWPWDRTTELGNSRYVPPSISLSSSLLPLSRTHTNTRTYIQAFTLTVFSLFIQFDYHDALYSSPPWSYLHDGMMLLQLISFVKAEVEF